MNRYDEAPVRNAILVGAPAGDVCVLGEQEMPSAHVGHTVQRVRAGQLQPAVADHLAEETPIALEYNGISHATMLATPTDLEDFARGFSLTEGIIDKASDIRGIDIVPMAQGVVVQLEIATACEVRLKGRRRALAGRTGCGLCGVETLPEVVRVTTPLPAGGPVSLASIRQAQRSMRQQQQLHDATGATHAAAWANAAGEVLCVREDVGRHNALDKLIGAIVDMPRTGGFVVVSSRASFEMVQKSVVAGIDTLAAVSAPTALATRLATEAGLLLIGFLRGEDCTIYTGGDRLSV